MASIEIKILNEKGVYTPIIENEVILETAKSLSPGVLYFSVVKDGIIDFTQGDKVELYYGEKPVFRGYVFTKRIDKNNVIHVTAYDQLRYLKNKDTYVYSGKKASELIVMLAKDFKLKYGEIEDTGFVIAEKTEDNKTIFDIIQNALDDTYKFTGKDFVLFDNFGQLELKNSENMNVDYVINKDTAENFNYETSIDKNTYNQIKLYKDEGKKLGRSEYFKNDNVNIGKWGVLQFLSSIKKDENGNVKVQELLKRYNNISKSLSIRRGIGDINVRGGSNVWVNMDVGEIVHDKKMSVEHVRHRLSCGGHFMDMILKGQLN